MPSSALARAAAVTAAAIAVAIALTGCAGILLFVPGSAGATGSSGGSGGTTGSSAAGKPAVGDCWHSTFSQAQSLATWTGEAQIGCSQTHQLYTYGVAEVTSSAPTWRSTGGDLDGTIATAAYEACGVKFTAFVPSGAPQSGRLQQYFFVPSEADWAKGARWVRCDVGVLAVGSSFEESAFEALPAKIATLVSQVAADPESFADCVTTTDPTGKTGPFEDPNAVIADCTKDFQWQYESSFTVPGADGVPYPSDDALNTIIQTACGDSADTAGRGWISYVPTSAQWDAGRRDGSCWFYNGSSAVDGGTTA